LCLSGINTDIFKAHSTRSAATSATFVAGIPIADILMTAGWTSECTFAKYYNKPVMSCLGDAVFTFGCHLGRYTFDYFINIIVLWIYFKYLT